MLLPNTPPPYATDGHLIARLHQPGGAVFEYQKFDGRIGDSDIHGDLKYVAVKPRPTLSGAVSSPAAEAGGSGAADRRGFHATKAGAARRPPAGG